jgi:hypothetical protein
LIQIRPRAIRRRGDFWGFGFLLHNTFRASVSDLLCCKILLFKHLQECCQLATFPSMPDFGCNVLLRLTSCRCGSSHPTELDECAFPTPGTEIALLNNTLG